MNKFILMNKDKPVLLLDMEDDCSRIIDILDILDRKYLPIGIKYSHDRIDRRSLSHWYEGRCIPSNRPDITYKLQSLGLHDAKELIGKYFALSLSDQYWIKPENANLNWKDINFFQNDFSEDIGNYLFDNILPEHNICFNSPDNTLDGWLPKKWKIIDGKRCLIKSGSVPWYQEPLNEIIASALFKRMPLFPFVEYVLIKSNGLPCSLCKNFITEDTELVTAHYLNQTLEEEHSVNSFQHTIKCMESIGLRDAKQFLDYLLTCDYILANTDRHFNNFGVIRNVNTLSFTGFAPIFDTGSSLCVNQRASSISVLNVESKPFRKRHEEQIKLVTDFSWFDETKLKDFTEEANEILKDSYLEEPERDKRIYGLQQRIEQVKNLREQSLNAFYFNQPAR